MGIPRWRQLVVNVAQSSDTGVYTYDLPERGALHALSIRASIDNGATSGRNKTPMDALNEIKITSDQQFPLYHLSPEEAEKVFELDNGRALKASITEAADATQYMVFPVEFGRRRYDPEMFLPLSRIQDAKIEIDHAFTPAADGGFATGTLKFSVMALITQEESDLPYIETLITRRIFKVTTAASGERQFELPTRSRIRRIGVYQYEAGVSDATNVTALRLEDANSGDLLAKFNWSDFMDINYRERGALIDHVMYLLAQDDDTLNTRLSPVIMHDLSPELAPNNTTDVFLVAVIDAIAGDQVTLASSTATIAAGSEVLATDTSDRAIRAKFTGPNVGYFGFINCNYSDRPGDYLDVSMLGGVDLIIEEGNAGASLRISIQEALTL